MPSTRATLNHRERERATRLHTYAALILGLAVAIVLVVVLGMAVHHALASLADHLNRLAEQQQSRQQNQQ